MGCGRLSKLRLKKLVDIGLPNRIRVFGKSVQVSTKIQELPSLSQKNKKARTNAGPSAYKNNNVPINTYIYIVDNQSFIYRRLVGRGFALVHACVHVDEKLGRTGRNQKRGSSP